MCSVCKSKRFGSHHIVAAQQFVYAFLYLFVPAPWLFAPWLSADLQHGWSSQCCVLLVLCAHPQALLADVWPDLLRTLAGFLCPFRAMLQRQQQEAMAAAAAAAASAASSGAVVPGTIGAAAPPSDGPARTPKCNALPGSPHASGPIRTLSR